MCSATRDKEGISPASQLGFLGSLQTKGGLAGCLEGWKGLIYQIEGMLGFFVTGVTRKKLGLVELNKDWDTSPGKVQHQVMFVDTYDVFYSNRCAPHCYRLTFHTDQ